jgi:hypothetical protein
MPYSIKKICKRCAVIYKVLNREIQLKIKSFTSDEPIHPNPIVRNKVLDDKIYYNNFSVFKDHPCYYSELIEKNMNSNV